MAKKIYPSVEQFFQNLIENITPILLPFKDWFVSLEIWSYFTREVRVYIWSGGVILCLVLLIYLLFLRNNLIGLLKNIFSKNKETVINLIKIHGISENFTSLVVKILSKDKNNKLFFEDAHYFEKLVIEYTKKENLTATEENEISQIRHKLQFTTIASSTPFVRTQQIHNGCILKASLPDSSYDISFETKVIENYESYFLVSYPQIAKEDYVLSAGQEILFETIIAGAVYHFKSEVVATDNNINNFAGLKLSHTNSVTKNN